MRIEGGRASYNADPYVSKLSLKVYNVVFSPVPGAGQVLRDAGPGLLQVPPRGLRGEGHLCVRVALHEQGPQLEEDQALQLLGHAGACQYGGARGPPPDHQDTLSLQGG